MLITQRSGLPVTGSVCVCVCVFQPGGAILQSVGNPNVEGCFASRGPLTSNVHSNGALQYDQQVNMTLCEGLKLFTLLPCSGSDLGVNAL